MVTNSVLVAENVSLLRCIAHLMILNKEITVLILPMATVHLLLQALNRRLRLCLLLVLSRQKIFTRLPWTTSHILRSLIVKVILGQDATTDYFTAPQHLGSRIISHVIDYRKLLFIEIIRGHNRLKAQLVDNQLSLILLLLLLLNLLL